MMEPYTAWRLARTSALDDTVAKLLHRGQG